MTDVFISYSRKDTTFVRKLFDALESAGKDAWVDWENIPLTADWLEEIKDGIEEADSFIFIISPDSVHSDVCAEELTYALENKKRLIPIMHRDLVESYDQAALHPMISSHNWLFFRDTDDFNAAFSALVTALDADLSHMRAHTRLLVKAKEWSDRSQDHSLLLHGNDLREAEEWLTTAMSKQPEPTELHTTYIMSSHNLSNSRQRATLIRVTIALVVSIGLAILSLVLFGVARRAQQQEALAARVNSSLAVAARAQQTTDRELAIALALAASRVEDAPGLVERALADVVYSPGVRHIFDDPDSDAALSAVAYAPGSLVIASASGDTSIVFWEAATEQLIRRLGAVGNSDPSIGHTGVVTSLTFNSAGDTLLTSSTDGRVLLWDVDTGTIDQIFDAEVGINDATYDSREARILAGLDDGRVIIWDVLSGDITLELTPEMVAVEDLDESAVSAVAFSPDESRIVAGQASGRVFVWNIEAEVVVASERVHRARVTSVKYTHDGGNILTSSDDEYAHKLSPRVLRIETDFVRHTNQVTDFDISPDGRYGLTTSRDRTVVYWDINNGSDIQRLWAHDNWVNGVAFSENGKRAATVSADGTVIEWDLTPGNIIQTYKGHTDMIRAVDMSNDGTRAVSGSDDDTIRVWDIVSGETIVGPIEGHTDDVRGVQFLPDDSRIVSASLDGTARVWDATTGELVAGPYQPHPDGVELNSLDIAPDGVRAITGGDDGSVRVWDITTGEVLMDLVGHDDVVLDARISSDGFRALTASEDSTVRYWDLVTGETIHVLEGHGREALSVAFSPDGTHAVSGSRDAEFFYWNLETGLPVRPEVIEHGSSVRGVAYSPNGKLAISASADLLMLVWDLDSGEVIREFRGHDRTVYSVDFSSDGSQAISGSRDGTLILWRVDDLEALEGWVQENRVTRHLTDEECSAYRISCDYTLPGEAASISG